MSIKENEIINSSAELNLETGETIIREMTEEELLFTAKLQEEHTLMQEHIEQVKLDRQSAINKLAALGLTEAEVSAVLGL
jgi:hypothetical protein